MHQSYGGFWKRSLAYLIDAVLLGVAGSVMNRWVAGTAGSVAGAVVLGWLYYAFMESSDSQATFGKLALGMMVTDQDGQQITFGKATVRYFGKFVSGALLLIGFVMAAFTARKQALHDLIAGTLVLERKSG